MSLTLQQLEGLAFRQPKFQIAVVAMRHLQPHLVPPWSLSAKPNGDVQSDRFLLTLQTHDPSSQRPISILVIEFAEDVVAIPTVFLPQHLWHQGLMVAVLGHMTAKAEAMQHRLIICDLVPRYQSSLLARGARQLDVPDAVELHSQMNFQPASAPQQE